MAMILLVFGRFLDIAIKIVLILSIIEYFTGIFSKLFSWWEFAPIILIGKIIGGIIAVFFALWLGVPMARKLEAKDRENGVIGKEEYLEEEAVLEERRNRKQKGGNNHAAV